MRWRQVILLYVVAAVLGGEYWLVERHRQPAAARPARRRFLPIGRDDVREVRLRRGGREIVARRAEGRWSVVEPREAPIPPDLVAAFTDALTAAEEIEVMAEGGDPTAYGLDATAAHVELVGGEGSPVVVTIGGPNPTGTAVYARRGDAPPVLIGRNARDYEDMLFQALPAVQIPAGTDHDVPVGG